jgi:multiple antibiotic resistance protein
MHDAIKVFVVVVSALFPIVDPLSASPIFLALTSNIMPATRRKLSWQVTLNSFILLVGSYFMGSHVLDFVGVSLPAVQVGGRFCRRCRWLEVIDGERRRSQRHP